MSAHTTEAEAPVVGRMVPGYAVPVVNEHQVRAGAALLLVGGAIAYGFSLANWNPALMKPFGFIFMWDMLARTSLGERLSPSLLIGGWLVRHKEPYWVGAKAKTFAWYLGLGMALAACFTMGWLAAPAWVTLAICGVCITVLFLEAAFGICVGCRLQAILSNDPPEHCPGGTCPIPTHSHASKGTHVP